MSRANPNATIDYSEFMRLIRSASLCLMEGWLFLLLL
jgi:hypothetical protein